MLLELGSLEFSAILDISYSHTGRGRADGESYFDPPAPLRVIVNIWTAATTNSRIERML